MKKIISILVVAMMVFSLFAVSVGATDIDADSFNSILEGADKEHFGGFTSADVKIKIENALHSRYAVDIVFENVVFTPSQGAIWDATRHEYYHNDDVTWVGEGKVTVKNHSDAPITYAADATVTAVEFGVDIVFNDTTEYAPIAATQIAGCAIGATIDQVPSAEFTYGVVGVPTVATLATTTLGTIRVTVAPV